MTVENIILEHNKKNSPTAIKAGVTLSWRQFRKIFSPAFPRLIGITPVKTVNAIHYVNAYMKINRVLAENGMAIKSTKYLTEFHILGKGDVVYRTRKARGDKDAVTAKINACNEKIEVLKKYAEKLKAGVDRSNCVFKPLPPEVSKKYAIVNSLPISASGYGRRCTCH